MPVRMGCDHPEIPSRHAWVLGITGTAHNEREAKECNEMSDKA